MKMSAKSEYGLRAMAALAGYDGSAPVSLREIAGGEHIPVEFLEQIFVDLRRAGFVRSVRGVKGGYLLARPAEDITLRELLNTLEGSLAPMDCLKPDSGTTCALVDGCSTRKVWIVMMASMTEALGQMTLADLLTPHPAKVAQDV